jgi:Predicted transcriptional regulators
VERVLYTPDVSVSTSNGKEPIYLKLANTLESMIVSRALRPGDRVPSVRQFSSQQRVRNAQIERAIAVLGHLVSRMDTKNVR